MIGPGLAFPFVGEKLRQRRPTRIIAVAPEGRPTLTRRTYAYDFGDTVGLAPLLGQLVDDAYPAEAIPQALTELPRVAVPA